MTITISIERARSDYLAVCRNAALYGPGEYEEAEARAWERLQRAIAAGAGADSSTTANASGGRPGPQSPVSTT